MRLVGQKKAHQVTHQGATPAANAASVRIGLALREPIELYCIIKVRPQHTNYLNRPATSRPSYTTRSLARRVPSHWQTQGKKTNNFQCSLLGGYYTAISYDVIHDVFVLFSLHLLKRKLKRFGLLLCSQTKV